MDEAFGQIKSGSEEGIERQELENFERIYRTYSPAFTRYAGA